MLLAGEFPASADISLILLMVRGQCTFRLRLPFVGGADMPYYLVAQLLSGGRSHCRLAISDIPLVSVGGIVSIGALSDADYVSFDEPELIDILTGKTSVSGNRQMSQPVVEKSQPVAKGGKPGELRRERFAVCPLGDHCSRYGMALAQAQHLVRWPTSRVERFRVRYAIHPVAGRCPVI